MDPVTAPFHALDSLGVVTDAAGRSGETLTLASRHLDPSLVDLLRILGFDKEYTSARGSYLYDSSGNAYLDFHTGEGFASLGHNHPGVAEVLHASISAELLDGVQLHYSALAGMLAEALAERLPEGLDAVFFASSGAEAVDSAMKFARAATGRPRLITCEQSFHGVTLGPLSVVGEDFFQEGFGPLLPGCKLVPYGDLAALEHELRKKDVAAFIVEPIQGRTVMLPPPGYLKGAEELCRRYGTLFCVDEIQTGLARTGRWFALEHWGLEPDFVLVGKALSGGYMPVSGMVTTREIYQRAVGTLERCYVHQSTFGRNRLSMAAGLATMRLVEKEGLVERAAHVGAVLRSGSINLQHRYDMIKEVRGSGLMIGIELCAPSSRVGRLNWRVIHLASEGLFPQLIVIPLHRDHNVITMAAGKNDVIKLLPPLTLSQAEAQVFLDALEAVLADCERRPVKNWAVVRDIASATLRRRSEVDRADDSPASEPVRPSIESAQRSGVAVRDELCLITGASGFIGGYLAQRLVDEGKHVRCLVRNSSDTSLLDELDVELVVGDLTSPRSLVSATRGCRYVLHCGAMVSDWATAEEIAGVNVDGTRNLLEASMGAPVERLIHFSTTDVYGYPGASKVDETYAGTTFRNWYAQSKRVAEHEVTRAHSDRGLRTVILRPATVYGPRSTDVVGEIARAIRNRSMLLIGGGRAVAGLCYVENLADAAVLALCHDAAPGEAFNVTDGLRVTWKEFTDKLAEGLDCSRVRFSLPYWAANGIGFSLEHGYRALRKTTRLKTAPLLSRQAVHVLGTDQDFSNRKARELLGWEPRVGYEAGMQATVEWLRSDYL